MLEMMMLLLEAKMIGKSKMGTSLANERNDVKSS